MRGMKAIMGIGFASMLAASASAQSGSDRIEVEVDMIRASGAPGDADGKVRFRDDGSRTSVRAELEDVPVGDYDFYVNDILRATVTVVSTASGTEGEVQFRNPLDPGKPLLDFDPRGQVVEWRSDGDVVLSRLMPTEQVNESEDDSFQSQKIKKKLDVIGTSNSSGTIQFKSKRNKADFRLRFKGLVPNRVYTVTADDVELGTVKARRNGKGRLDMSTRPRGKKINLPVDPARAVIEVWDDDVVILSTTLDGIPLGAGFASSGDRIEVDMDSSGADVDAHGEAELRLRRRGRIDFQVEIEDIDIGTYDMRVDGVVVATIDVTTQFSGGTEGEVEFSTDNSESNKLLLDFEPAGAFIEIVQSGTVYLSVTFPS